MAVLGKLKAVVRVNGEKLREYDDYANEEEEDNGQQQDSSDPVTTKYIEAVSNAEFDLEFTVDKGFSFRSKGVVFNTYFDGQLVDAPIIFPPTDSDKSREKLYCESYFASVKEHGKTTRRAYKFSDAKIS